MTTDEMTPGIRAGRLAADAYARNFADLTPPLGQHEAAVAADRCYFCYDAPCIAACPTAIDIPLFIRQIATGAVGAAGRTIFDQNILGGMCARVCPTETLCEEACVREAAEGAPVQISRLQRHATDAVMAQSAHPYVRAPSTGRRVAVVGAGPAGLACAHRLAMLGHDVLVHDARPKAGGLNEYGIASYKATGGFAQAEVDWLLGIGGIEVVLGEAASIDDLTARFDAVFLAVGLDGVNALGTPGGDLPGVDDAVDFIAALRQADDVAALPVGRDVVVVGGGMTAVDAAVQARLLGAANVTIAYRRGRERMSASTWELDLAATRGVRIVTDAQPVAVLGDDTVRAVEFAHVREGKHGLEPTGEMMQVAADQVLLAIGQGMRAVPHGLAVERGRIAVDARGRTSRPGVWAGGDCAAAGDDLTVTAVAQGRDAAMDIHAALTGGANG